MNSKDIESSFDNEQQQRVNSFKAFEAIKFNSNVDSHSQKMSIPNLHTMSKATAYFNDDNSRNKQSKTITSNISTGQKSSIVEVQGFMKRYGMGEPIENLEVSIKGGKILIGTNQDPFIQQSA